MATIISNLFCYRRSTLLLVPCVLHLVLCVMPMVAGSSGSAQFIEQLVEACRAAGDPESAARLKATLERAGLVPRQPVPAAIVTMDGSERRYEDGIDGEEVALANRILLQLLQRTACAQQMNQLQPLFLSSNVPKPQQGSSRGHAERKALAALLTRGEARLQVTIEFNACAECHEFFKCASQLLARKIQLFETRVVHTFTDGRCSCNDRWFIEATLTPDPKGGHGGYYNSYPSHKVTVLHRGDGPLLEETQGIPTVSRRSWMRRPAYGVEIEVYRDDLSPTRDNEGTYDSLLPIVWRLVKQDFRKSTAYSAAFSAIETEARSPIDDAWPLIAITGDGAMPWDARPTVTKMAKKLVFSTEEIISRLLGFDVLDKTWQLEQGAFEVKTGPQEASFPAMLEMVEMLSSLIGLADEVGEYDEDRLVPYAHGVGWKRNSSETSKKATSPNPTYSSVVHRPTPCHLNEACEYLNTYFKDHRILRNFKTADSLAADHDVRLTLPTRAHLLKFWDTFRTGVQVTFEVEIGQLSNEHVMGPLFTVQRDPSAAKYDGPGYEYWRKAVDCLHELVGALRTSEGGGDSVIKREIGQWLRDGTVQFGGALLFLWRMLPMTWIEGRLLNDGSKQANFGRNPGTWKTEFAVFPRNSGIDILLEEAASLAAKRGWGTPHKILRVFIGALKAWATSQDATMKLRYWGAKPGKVSNIEEKCFAIDALLAEHDGQNYRSLLNGIWKIVYSMDKARAAEYVWVGLRFELRWFPTTRTEDGRYLVQLEDRGTGMVAQTYKAALVETLLAVPRHTSGMLVPSDAARGWINMAMDAIMRGNPVWAAKNAAVRPSFAFLIILSSVWALSNVRWCVGMGWFPEMRCQFL